VMASIIGMGVVMIFMLVYYKGAGINADLALILNLLILLGFMATRTPRSRCPASRASSLPSVWASTPTC
jgi:hypothetical protein